MRDEKLLAFQGSTRRSVSSSVAGIIINSVLGAACPIFLVGAGISLWQTVVSSINRHRTKREVKHRKKIYVFRALIKEVDHPVRDVILGCAIKTGCSMLAAGIVGTNNIADNFDQLFHADALNNSTYPAEAAKVHYGLDADSTGAEPSDGHLHRAAEFEEKHPHSAAADKALHKVVAGIGDAFSESVATQSDMKINSETNWFDLQSNASQPGVVPQILAVGAVNEFMPVVMAAEIGIDDRLRRRQEADVRKRKEGYESLQH